MSEPQDRVDHPEGDVRERLLATVRALALELHPGRHDLARLGLTDPLDAGFGIDSLARVELGIRIEQAFGVRLGETALMDAETPAELLGAIATAPAGPGPRRAPAAPLAAGAAATPDEAATLVDALDFHRRAHAERVHIRVLSEGEDETITYGGLWDAASATAAGLAERDVDPGQAVAIMLPTGLAFFHAFIGALIAGAVPVPIYPPVRRAQIGPHLGRQAAILDNARALLLITTEDARPFARLIQAQVESLRGVVTVDELAIAGAGGARPARAAEDTALIQYTSGSTGDPKGVVLSHANLLANIRGLGEALAATAADVVVSWLPLYHDMGLIGNWLGSLYYACPMVVMSPLRFLARPERWLWAISDHRGTLSAGPNFAYELCVSRIREDALAGLDLSSWRMAGNGAEAVSARTIERFAARFAPYGFRAQAMTPMYGLAECAVALALTPLGRGPKIERMDGGERVSSGVPLRGHEIRIVDEAGRELGEREEGRIEFRGPSATSGYFRDPVHTAALFRHGWLDTGDLGIIVEGELTVTGRVKDIIIRAGRNLYPEEIEAAVGDIAAVRKGRVAVFPSLDPQSGTERLVVLAETRLGDPARRAALVAEIDQTVADIAELPPDEVALAPPGTVLKTENGKIRRAACRALYEEGRIGQAPPAAWRQVLGLALASLRPAQHRAARALAALAYAAWFQSVYRLLAVPVWLLIATLPGVRRRRRVFGAAGRLMLRLLGLGPDVAGADNLPRAPYLVVANHASFLDGLVLAAALPPDFAFVAKRELAGGLIGGLFLRRLGTAFVERVDPAAGVAGTRSLVEALGRGRTLVFFPEGTFDRRPGLRAFRMGAFVAAAAAGVPVVPAAIRGTRGVLRGESAFARRGRIGVRFAPPVRPRGSDWPAALELRDRAREAVLAGCGEPDLVDEPIRIPA